MRKTTGMAICGAFGLFCGAIGCDRADSTADPPGSGAQVGAAGSGRGGSGSGSSSGATKLGEPVEKALDVRMPAGTRKVSEESGGGLPGQGLSCVWLVSPLPPPEAAAFFLTLTGQTDAELRSFSVSLPAGSSTSNTATVTVAPIGEIPTTCVAPVHPVVDAAPPGAASWFTVRAEQQLGCPPCPEGFVGTLVPSCTCP